MAKILITGSADGLGQLAAKDLVEHGHEVVLHARNKNRGEVALNQVPGAAGLLVADLTNLAETKQLAEDVNALGTFDAIIHNAGVYNASAKELFSVNAIAPYVLTCLVNKPKRLIYLSSDMHEGGRSKLDSFQNNINSINYSDTKLHVVMLCKAVARLWPGVYANALNPGWVPTKMGGAGAPDDLTKGYETQVWLAVSNDESAKVSGRYFYHQQQIPAHPEADNVQLQEQFLALCKKITGVALTS